MTDINTILPALRELKPGQSMVYHEGLLAKDRDRSAKPTDPHATEINLIANEMANGFLRGELELTQRRLAPQSAEVSSYAYIATRRIKPGPDRTRGWLGWDGIEGKMKKKVSKADVLTVS